MAHRDLTPLRSLLPTLLARVAQEGGSARGLSPIWEEAAGAVIARHARPVAWEGRRLILAVREARWRRELEAQAPELLARLAAVLGPRAPERLQFRIEP